MGKIQIKTLRRKTLIDPSNNFHHNTYMYCSAKLL
jgi:hypothetical protein